MDMEMKTNARRLKHLRESKSWSQEHLAEASGLSLRTVQRVETDGNASPETRLALAGALGVDVVELGIPKGMPAMDPPQEKARSVKTGFIIHSVIYGVVCSGMALLDWSQHGRLIWAFWPVFGWGIGLFFHGLKLLKPFGGR